MVTNAGDVSGYEALLEALRTAEAMNDAQSPLPKRHSQTRDSWLASISRLRGLRSTSSIGSTKLAIAQLFLRLL